MSQQIDGNTRTFEADAAIALYARVKLDSDGKITTAAVGDKDIGTATREAFAAGDLIAVKLRTASGTHKMLAQQAIDAGAELFTEDSGKVSDVATTGAHALGTALEAATADGDVIEALYNSHGDDTN